MAAVVAGDADLRLAPEQPARFGDVAVVLAEMDAVGPELRGEIGAVVDDERDVIGGEDRLDDLAGAEDLEIALTAMAGPDAIDGRGWTLTLPRSKKTSLREFKVAVLLTRFIVLLPAVRAFISPEYTPEVFLRGILVGLGVALLGALYPAFRAARLSPAEASPRS